MVELIELKLPPDWLMTCISTAKTPETFIVAKLIFIAIALFVLQLIGGYTFLQIDDASVLTRPERLKGRTRTEFVSATIYGANCLLIAAAIAAFCFAEKTKPSDDDRVDIFTKKIIQAMKDFVERQKRVTIESIQLTDEQAQKIGLQITETLRSKIVIQTSPIGVSERIERTEAVFFSNDSRGGLDVKADQEPVRGQVSRIISRWQNDIQTGRCAIVLTGSTDTTGPDSYNDQLSRRRIDIVRSLILDILAPATVSISTMSEGERNLPVKTLDEITEWRNRRVDISLRCAKAVGP